MNKDQTISALQKITDNLPVKALVETEGGLRFLSVADIRISGKGDSIIISLEHGPNFSPIPDYGDKMTVKDFAQGILSGAFTDDDGNGSWAKENEMSDMSFVPSRFYLKPDWATHVIWFNK